MQTKIKHLNFDHISQRNATSRDNKNGSVTVAPVEYYSDGGAVLFTSSITLKKEPDTWKIAELDLSQVSTDSEKEIQSGQQIIRDINSPG